MMQNAVRSSMSVLVVLTSDRSFHRVKIEDALKVVTCMQLSHAISNACVFACLCVCMLEVIVKAMYHDVC